jgi:hypothetical protein
MGIGSISSGNETRLIWMRWIIPSIADLIFVALLGLVAFTALSVRLLGDAGIGWHIRTGQLILSSQAIPRVDPFSSSVAGQPWFAWEWLYDAMVGWLDRAAGLNGVVFLTALIIALTFSWAFRLLLRRGTNVLVALALVLLAVSAAMIHFLARPHVLSWLFSMVWFWILDSSERNPAASPGKVRQHRYLVWLLPLFMVVWVNVHGGFLLGFALLGIYWFSSTWQWFRLSGDRFENVRYENARFEDVLQKFRAGKRSRDLAVIGGLSTLATLVNPNGWRLPVHIYGYLSNRFLMDHIDEFQSPNFHGVAQKCFAILLLLTLVALAAKRRGPVLASEFLLILFAVYSGLYASRNIPVSALLLILVIGPRLSDALQSLADGVLKRSFQSPASPHFLSRMQSIDLSLRGHLWPIAAIILTGWIVFHGGKLGSDPLMNAHFDAKRFPVAAVEYLEKQSVPSSVFAPDSWGGYLIYRLYPETKVSVDDRHDFYGEAFLKSYLKTEHVEPGWQDFLLEHRVGGIMVPKDSALANILLETPRWQMIYTDDVTMVFEPAGPSPKP